MKWNPWMPFALWILLAGCAETRRADRVAPSPPAAVPERPALPGRVEAALWPPDRVLAQADAIALSAEQRRAIDDDVRRTQAAWDVLAERLRGEESALVAVLERPQIDAAEAERAAQAVVRTEGELKTTHLALLVRVKNLLTDAQKRALTR